MCKNIRYNLNYNPDKPKDKLVTDYLARISSSETEEIKSILFKVASGQYALVPVFALNQHILAQSQINAFGVNLTQSKPNNTELHENENSEDVDFVSDCADSAQEEAGSAIMSFFGNE